MCIRWVHIKKMRILKGSILMFRWGLAKSSTSGAAAVCCRVANCLRAMQSGMCATTRAPSTLSACRPVDRWMCRALTVLVSVRTMKPPACSTARYDTVLEQYRHDEITNKNKHVSWVLCSKFNEYPMASSQLLGLASLFCCRVSCVTPVCLKTLYCPDTTSRSSVVVAPPWKVVNFSHWPPWLLFAFRCSYRRLQRPSCLLDACLSLYDYYESYFTLVSWDILISNQWAILKPMHFIHHSWRL